jgi:sarcosine oxidase, subunit delta
MMQIDCPFCGRRDEVEFTYGGEAHIARPDMKVGDEEWTNYLFFRNNMNGIHAERWRHARGCGQWFNALRNTATHQFVAFYRVSDARPTVPVETGPR